MSAAAVPGERSANRMQAFARVGNNLSADFINTVVSFDRDGGTLRSADDVVDFLVTTGAVAAPFAEGLRTRLCDAAVAERFLATALALRVAVTAALTAIARREPIGDDVLARINAILAADAGYEQLEPHSGGYRVERRYIADDPAIALVPVARDVARLIATPGVPVRKCAGEGCVRHFYDDSRTGRRRWCEMAICGNRAKAAAFAARERAAARQRP